MIENHKSLILLIFILLLLVSLTVWNMTLTYKAMDIANHAYRKAGKGHPEFFTLKQAAEDKKTHDQRHRRAKAALRREFGQQTKLIDLELGRKIDKIPTRPKDLEALCDELSDRVLKLEVKNSKS